MPAVWLLQQICHRVPHRVTPPPPGDKSVALFDPSSGQYLVFASNFQVQFLAALTHKNTLPSKGSVSHSNGNTSVRVTELHRSCYIATSMRWFKSTSQTECKKRFGLSTDVWLANFQRSNSCTLKYLTWPAAFPVPFLPWTHSVLSPVGCARPFITWVPSSAKCSHCVFIKRNFSNHTTAVPRGPCSSLQQNAT